MLTSADRELASDAQSIVDTEEGRAGNDRATMVLTSSQSIFNLLLQKLPRELLGL